MKIYFDYKKFPRQRTVVTLGNFDGFHLGHQQILAATVAQAAVADLPTLVVTFQPHPRRLFGVCLPTITPIGRKLALLKKAGTDAALVQPFTPAFAAISPRGFFVDVLVNALGCKELVVGYDYSFGQGGVGDTALMRRLATDYGVGLKVVPPVKCGGQVVSSSGLRRFLAHGQVELAAQHMGRPFVISGRVVGGDRRGRLLGFPTANIHPSPALAQPAHGVYLVAAHTKNASYWGVANLGLRPTFSGRTLVLETHLFDFSGSLYGKRLEIGFFKRLRPEQNFADANSLRQQQQQDIKLAKTLLASANMLKLDLL